jgi:hypothetical protein
MFLTPVLESLYFLFWWNQLYYYGAEVVRPLFIVLNVLLSDIGIIHEEYIDLA